MKRMNGEVNGNIRYVKSRYKGCIKKLSKIDTIYYNLVIKHLKYYTMYLQYYR